MKRLATFALTLFLSIAVSGCAIPDLPGPIGIPGIEAEPLTLLD